MFPRAPPPVKALVPSAALVACNTLPLNLLGSDGSPKTSRYPAVPAAGVPPVPYAPSALPNIW